MHDRLRRWWGLPASERLMLATLLVLVPLVSAGLRFAGYRRTLAALEHISARARTHAPSASELWNAHRMAELAALAGRRGVVTATCLRQALAVHFLLRRRGLASVVRLGVDRIGPSPDMHAWVELHGERLAQADARHRPFG